MHKSYDKLAWIVKLLLQIFLGGFVSPIYRIVKGIEKKDMMVLIVGIIAIPFTFIFWVIDLITIILSNKISFLA